MAVNNFLINEELFFCLRLSEKEEQAAFIENARPVLRYFAAVPDKWHEFIQALCTTIWQEMR